MFVFISDANDDSFYLLVQTNDRCQSILKWYFLIAHGTYFFIIPVFAIISVVSNMGTDYNPADLYRPYQVMWVNVISKPTIFSLNEKNQFNSKFCHSNFAVSHGTKSRCAAISWKFRSPIYCVADIFKHTAQFYCSSFPCVCFIKHFPECFSNHCTYLMRTLKIDVVKTSTNYSNFILQWKSEYEMKSRENNLFTRGHH